MPTIITVLSWNIESLGAGKATNGAVQPAQSEIINFISLAVQLTGADLVGIMEVKSGLGTQILTWLLGLLNNARPAPPPYAYTWQGRVSARQDGGTQEEYLYLWKQEQNRLTLDPNGVPGPTSLVGVVDGNALETLFGTLGWTAAQQQVFYQALQGNNYVVQGKFKQRASFAFTTTWRVVPAAWNTLNTPPNPPVAFANPPAPPPGLNPARLQSLATQLLNIDILRFNTYGDRSPFLGNFVVGNPPKQLMVSLLHAPGPQDLTRTDAINIMGLSLPMMQAVQQNNLLLMGDFNIDDMRALPTARVYGRYLKQGNFVFAQLPAPVPTQPVFAPLTGAPLTAPDLLWQQQTSLVNAFIPDNSLPNAALGNTFDKFFFHGSATAANQIAASPAQVCNLVQAIAANQGAGVFNAALAQSALTFFRAFRGPAFLTQRTTQLTKLQAKAQKTVNTLTAQLNAVNTKINNLTYQPPKTSPLVRRKQNTTNNLNKANGVLTSLTSQLTSIATTQALVTPPVANAATGIGTALAFYRYAVSDHLPIRVQLTA